MKCIDSRLCGKEAGRKGHITHAVSVCMHRKYQGEVDPFMVAASGAGKSETGVEEGRDLAIIPFSLLDFVLFAPMSCSKTSA